jgi:hypothetical protein
MAPREAGRFNELNCLEVELKALHLLYIKELYKDREAKVVPFDRNLILATCFNCLDSKDKTEFLKQ